MFEHGFQAWVARKMGEHCPTINCVFKGKRRATVKQAAKLEELFIQKCIPLDRWDLLYGVEKGQTLEDYLKAKISQVKEN